MQGVVSMGLFVLAGVFFLKVAWNLTVPFELARRKDERAGISLMPVEIGVWVLWLLLAFFSDGDGWWQSPKKVAVWGGIAILGSYAAMMPLGAGLGLLAAARAKWKCQPRGPGGEGKKPTRRRGGFQPQRTQRAQRGEGRGWKDGGKEAGVMRTKRRKVSAWGRAGFVARWLAGVVLVLACGVAEGAEGRAETWEKLGEIVVPKFEFEGAAAKDVLDYVGEITGMGVRMEPGALEGAPPLTIHLREASLRDIVWFVAEVLNCRAELEEDGSGFVFRPREFIGGGIRLILNGADWPGWEWEDGEDAQDGEGALRAQ